MAFWKWGKIKLGQYDCDKKRMKMLCPCVDNIHLKKWREIGNYFRVRSGQVVHSLEVTGAQYVTP